MMFMEKILFLFLYTALLIWDQFLHHYIAHTLMFCVTDFTSLVETSSCHIYVCINSILCFRNLVLHLSSDILHVIGIIHKFV